ncbi:hypothetical protein ACS0TY_014929 [Phlomoides rotata]
MDLVARCKDKLTYFRVKELKDVLTHLSLSKQGKKQDLVDRILAVLSDDQGFLGKKHTFGKDAVAKLVDDTYRKMQVSGAADLASKSPVISDSSIVKPKEEVLDSYHIDKIRCLCGSPLPTDSMIKCEDCKCNVWQHISCVVIPEKPMEGILPSPPEVFYCEICRLSRADPFLLSIAHPLNPLKLSITHLPVPADGSNPNLSIEKTFQITRADKDLISKQEYDVQAWCMLLNDKVTFRMQWPQHAELQVNGVSVRAINRPGAQLLGANGRDDGPIISTVIKDGINKISLTGCDARIFCVGVRIVKRRTLRQILSLIPKEDEGERFEDALARVRKCVGGGAATENADSDSDIEIVADFVPVNLRCPMSGLRMKVAGRFMPCAHMGCFDLEVFVEMNQRSRKWQCPICLKNYSWEKIIRDPYFNRITSKMLDSGEDVSDIEVRPDGSWRAKVEGDRKTLGELGLWHSPDGTICASTEAEPKLKSIKLETGSDNHPALKLGIRKNQNGHWVVNRSGDNRGISPANRFQNNLDSNGQNIIPMSSSPTGSGTGEDVSVNQDGGGSLDFSTVNGTEYESTPKAFNEPFATAPAGDAEVIVISDSEEETVPLMSSEVVYKNNGPDTSGIQFSAPQHGIPDSYYEDPALGNGANSCLNLYNTNDDDYGLWTLPSGGQGVSSFQLFGSETALGSAALVPKSTAQHSNMNADLVDNSVAFSGNDPSLQLFLPTRPSADASTVQTELRVNAEVSSAVRTDWISLRLGDGDGDQVESAAGNELPLADETFRLGMNGNRTGKMSRERLDGPFQFPRQRRSVRQKLYLSIDSESE